MKLGEILPVFVVALVCSLNDFGATQDLSEKTLAKRLLDNYPLVGRPIKNASLPIKINITVILNQIVNEQDDSITLATYLFMKWKDEYLSWNPNFFGGLKRIVLPTRKIWIPDVFIWNDYYNNWAQQYDEMEAIDAWVYSDGLVAWNPTGIYRVLCNSDPNFRCQKNCTFTFGSLTHNTDEMDVIFDNDLADFNMTVLMPTPGIDVVAHSAQKVLAAFDIPLPNSQYWNMNYNIVVKLTDDAIPASRQKRSAAPIMNAPPRPRARRSTFQDN